MRSLALSLGFIAAFAWGGAASADERVAAHATESVSPVRNYFNLRAGPSTASTRPEICVEASPHARFGIEACGNGAGILHRDPIPEIAHFRGIYAFRDWQTAGGLVQPRVGVGFAEIQLDEDDPGFDFFGTGKRAIETAGPELGLSLRSLTPMYGGFELVGELGVSLAWFQHAPALASPKSRLQPSFRLTLGVGF